MYLAILTGTIFYLELEHCTGGSLDQWIEASKPPRWRVVKLLRDALRGLRHVHSVRVGPDSVVLHRDAKPSNILVDAERERGVLADFDIVRVACVIVHSVERTETHKCACVRPTEK